MRNQLLKAALIGTNNPGANISAKEVLHQSGIDFFQRQAGFVPQKSCEVLAEPAEVTTRCCDNAALAQFRRLQKPIYDDLLEIWIEKFQEANLHLPDELSPLLLDKTTRFNNPTESPMMSQKARWLIQHANKENWRWFLKHCEDDTNLGDNPPENPVLWFVKKRAANPSAAREWYTANWQNVDFIYHAGILHAFRDGLSEDDIPFLEWLLNSCEDKHIMELSYDIILLLSLLNAKCVQATLDRIFEMLRMAQLGRTVAIDFIWSGIFRVRPQIPKYPSWIKFAQKCNDTTLSNFIRLVPLERWHQCWFLGFKGMLKAASNGRNGESIATGFIKRVIDEKDQEIAIELLNHTGKLGQIRIQPYHNQLTNILSFEYFSRWIEQWVSHD